MSENSDIKLWERIKNGDKNSFSDLFHIYYESLYQFAGRYMFDAQSAENVVQDVFVNIWENRKKITINTNLKTYLYISTKNHCLNHIKHYKRNLPEMKIAINQQGNIQSPESDYIGKELTDSIYDAISLLPEHCRQIYLLKRFDDLKYTEISEILGISVNTVKTQMKRAVKFLIKKISPLLQII